jgi:starch phosphorylase
VTNGVHFPTWAASEWKALYNKNFDAKYYKDQSNAQLWEAIYNVPDEEIWKTRQVLKNKLVDYIKRAFREDWLKNQGDPSRIVSILEKINPNALIIGFARRVIAYKRVDLIFTDIERFERLIAKYNIQFVFSGKTHPKDEGSKRILMKLKGITERYPNNVVFIQDYDVTVAGLMTKGCDVWLGNPEIPLEACSTSGMKAACNGVLNLSTADGWWFKSCRYAVNGWVIGETKSRDKSVDAQYLYKVLEEKVLPSYKNEELWSQMMMSSIYTALEECSTDRMVRDYYRYLYNAPYPKENN